MKKQPACAARGKFCPAAPSSRGADHTVAIQLLAPGFGLMGRQLSLRIPRGLLEELQDRLARLVRNRQRLDAELLLDL